MREILLFAVLPYAALGLAFAVPPARAVLSRRREPLSLSWRALYRGSRAWRYGLGLLLAGHLFAFLLPGAVEVWDRVPLRLLILELSGFACGVLVFASLGSLLLGRAAAARTASNPPPLLASAIDTLFLTVLALDIVSGLGVAVFDRWGSAWYAATLLPYLRSLVLLRPEVGWVAAMPPLVKLHVLGGIVAVAVLPFTALGEVLARPFARPGEVALPCD